MANKKTKKDGANRRNFLKLGLMSSVSAVAGMSLVNNFSQEEEPKPSGEKIRLLTPDGKIVEVNADNINKYPEAHVTPAESRKGIPNRKFVMVIDLAKCKNARNCVEACQKAHHLDYNEEFLKIQLIKDSEEGGDYWFPKSCMHCDEPPCVTVCPTGATFKRDDGIVLIDNERCIGCRFCMAACPYSARVFNWGAPPEGKLDLPYSPETSLPSQVGTVEKCDFCPDMLRQNKVPHCITACPNGALYFGDKIADSVTNGSETVRFSTLLKDKAGYRYHEELGTEPNVYYLPPADRLFPFKEAPEEQPS